MALILNIDTATEHGSVCLSKDGVPLAIESNTIQKDHAAFLQPAIQKIMNETGHELSMIDAIALSNGPGSYTGLRVGLSSAKGIAYALEKPLILISTLEVMATTAKTFVTGLSPGEKPLLFIPMIDARRMEVFTAAYNDQLEQLLEPTALILDEFSFIDLEDSYTLTISGSGAEKFKNIVRKREINFVSIQHDARNMQSIAEDRYLLKSFADKAFCSPIVLKVSGPRFLPQLLPGPCAG